MSKSTDLAAALLESFPLEAVLEEITQLEGEIREKSERVRFLRRVARSVEWKRQQKSEHNEVSNER